MDPKESLSHDRSLSQTAIQKEQTTFENTHQTRVGGSHVKEEPSPDQKVDEHGNHNREDPQIKDEPATEQGTDDRSHNHGGLQSANGPTAVPHTTAHQGSSFDTAQQVRGETTHYTGAGSQQTNNDSHEGDNSHDAVGPTGVRKDHLDYPLVSFYRSPRGIMVLNNKMDNSPLTRADATNGGIDYRPVSVVQSPEGTIVLSNRMDNRRITAKDVEAVRKEREKDAEMDDAPN